MLHINPHKCWNNKKVQLKKFPKRLCHWNFWMWNSGSLHLTCLIQFFAWFRHVDRKKIRVKNESTAVTYSVGQWRKTHISLWKQRWDRWRFSVPARTIWDYCRTDCFLMLIKETSLKCWRPTIVLRRRRPQERLIHYTSFPWKIHRWKRCLRKHFLQHTHT